jgi:hypothetical protein
LAARAFGYIGGKTSEIVLTTLITSITTIVCAIIRLYGETHPPDKHKGNKQIASTQHGATTATDSRSRKASSNVLHGINWRRVILPTAVVGIGTLILTIIWLLPTSTSVCRVGYQCNFQSTGVNGDRACTDNFEIKTLPRVSGININMTQRALSSYGYSIWEVKAFESATRTNNLITSSGAQAAASSTEDPRYLPQKAIDGRMDTRWGSALCCIPFNTCPAKDTGGLQCNVAGADDPQSLEITFLKPETVGLIEVAWQDSFALDYCVVIHQKPIITDATYGISLIALIAVAIIAGMYLERKKTKKLS